MKEIRQRQRHAILVIDETTQMRSFFSVQLQPFTTLFELVLAVNAEEGQRLFLEHQPHLVAIIVGTGGSNNQREASLLVQRIRAAKYQKLILGASGHPDHGKQFREVDRTSVVAPVRVFDILAHYLCQPTEFNPISMREPPQASPA